MAENQEIEEDPIIVVYPNYDTWRRGETDKRVMMLLNHDDQNDLYYLPVENLKKILGPMTALYCWDPSQKRIDKLTPENGRYIFHKMEAEYVPSFDPGKQLQTHYSVILSHFFIIEKEQKSHWSDYFPFYLFKNK